MTEHVGHNGGFDDVVNRLAEICGTGNVLTGDAAARYGLDWRGHNATQPLAVVRPATTQQVSDIVKVAAASNLAIVPQGGNTGLVGGTQAEGALIVSLERMNTIRAIDRESRSVAVDAGVIVEKLDTALSDHNLRFPLSFGAKGSAMIGGALSTNAGGANVLAHGMVRASCLGIEVVMPDGQILNDMSDLRKNNTGFDLKQLFIGAEGTLGIITGAMLALIDRPAAYATALISTATYAKGLTVLNRLRRASGNRVEAFEVMPRSYFARMADSEVALSSPLSGDSEITILVELASSSPSDCTVSSDGSTPLTDTLTETLGAGLEDGLIAEAIIAQTGQQRQDMWQLREIAAELAGGITPLVAADVSVPLNSIDAFASELEQALRDTDPDAKGWMVGHLGDGNLHVVICPSIDTVAHLARVRALINEKTMQHAGSFSAEHGIGVQKLETMAAHKDPLAIDLMQRIKTVFDPKGIMNPGKVIPDMAQQSHATDSVFRGRTS
jgi:FAD/FMN-containing dehydrogenase